MHQAGRRAATDWLAAGPPVDRLDDGAPPLRARGE